MSENNACKGAVTTPCLMGLEHVQQCVQCKTKVRDDMVNHPFFGFAAGCGDVNSAPQEPAVVLV